MRSSYLQVFFLCLVVGAVQAQNLSSMGEKLLRELDTLICKELQAGIPVCTVTLESVTHHQTSPESSLWALKWKVSTPVKNRSESAWRKALANKQLQLLDINPDYLVGITYFRRQAEQFERLDVAAFSELALNTRYKAVAHFAPDLFRAGELNYILPANWQSDGLKAGDVGAITLTLPQWSAGHLALRITDLNDAPLKSVHIVSCAMREKDKTQTCNPDYLSLRLKSNSITITLSAEKKLPSSQPAFKLLLQEAGNAKVLLSLAIPYRARPNYLVFGASGFLFGALIAVMVLLLRKKPVNTFHAVSAHRQ